MDEKIPTTSHGRGERGDAQDSRSTYVKEHDERDVVHGNGLVSRKDASSGSSSSSSTSTDLEKGIASINATNNEHIPRSQVTTTSLPTENTSLPTNEPKLPDNTPQADDHTYPEGGLAAWLVVFGSFTGMTAGFGLMNTIGTFQAYLSTHQLVDYSPSTVGWIFSLYTFLAFFCGVQIGPIFDAKGPRWLVVAGSVCLVGGTLAFAESTSMFTPPPRALPLSTHASPPSPSNLALRSSYILLTTILSVGLWHFLLTFSILCGLGTSLIFTPAVAAISHWFLHRRAFATGLATTGGSIGGVIFPLMLQRLFPLVGFAWAVRVLALTFLALCIVANLLIRSRLPAPDPAPTVKDMLPDWRIFRKNWVFILTTAGVFFLEWALFVPLSYISSFALAKGINSSFAYQLLAVVNCGSFFGRWAPGLIADKVGRFNTMIATVALCLVSVLALWLPSNSVPSTDSETKMTPLIVVFGLLFGFASGSNISLTPVCVGQLCDTEVFGRWYAGLYTVVSFGCLTGLPIAGALLKADGGNYMGLILFTAVSYACGLWCFVWARVLVVGWKVGKIY